MKHRSTSHSPEDSGRSEYVDDEESNKRERDGLDPVDRRKRNEVNMIRMNSIRCDSLVQQGG